MRLMLVFARAYPARTAATLACLLLAAVFQGVGVSSMLPLVTLIARTDEPPNPLESQIREVLASVGIDLTVGFLLSFMVVAMVLKSALELAAKRQVGYSVAQVATDLRLSLLRAMAGARWGYFTRQPIG
ncbi:MAG: ABC transporter ATP-binding protein, partial [Proteobacteria bacterium]|nr:ABC transporter ATP-binding protein [Pseudomonadota bacterium]